MTDQHPAEPWAKAFAAYMRQRFTEDWREVVEPNAIRLLKQGFRAGWRARDRGSE